MKNKNKKVDFPELDRDLLSVTEKTILTSMAGGPDFRNDDDWPDTIIHLTNAGVRYVTIKAEKFSYFKSVPVGNFDLTINVGIESGNLSDENLLGSMPDYGLISKFTGLGNQTPVKSRRYFGGLKAEGLS